MVMHRHLRKKHFNYLAMSVMILEAAAFLVFIGATFSSILGVAFYNLNVFDSRFIIIGFGGVFASFMLMAIGELLQIAMKIEFNTRVIIKDEELIEKEIHAIESSGFFGHHHHHPVAPGRARSVVVKKSTRR